MSRRRSEAQITVEVEETKLRLRALHDERRGLLVVGNSDEVLLAWCCACGERAVVVSEGEDTCGACVSCV